MYVYQNAYLEFFCSKKKLDALIEKSKDRPFLTYMAMNKEGIRKSNAGQTDVNAVTWGVFPAKEIIQPTIVDPAASTCGRMRHLKFGQEDGQAYTLMLMHPGNWLKRLVCRLTNPLKLAHNFLRNTIGPVWFPHTCFKKIKHNQTNVLKT